MNRLNLRHSVLLWFPLEPFVHRFAVESPVPGPPTACARRPPEESKPARAYTPTATRSRTTESVARRARLVYTGLRFLIPVLAGAQGAEARGEGVGDGQVTPR